MLQFHNESKPPLFDYVLRIYINEKANTSSDSKEPPYCTEVLYPVSDQEIKLPKTFQGIGLFFFKDAKDNYLTKGHPRYELQWTEYTSFSFCLTDEKKNMFFVFAYLHSTSAYCVISDYYHPNFLTDFIYVLSITKNPSEFAQKINNIFINSSKNIDDYYYQEGEPVFLHEEYDWLVRNFQSENSESGSGSAYSMPLQGPKSSSTSNMGKNKVQLLLASKKTNLSSAKISVPTPNSLYGITHTNHMSPENEISELYKFIFSNLPVEYILMLIDALLLDFKIVIISKDVAKLGKAAFAIIGLLYPLKWPGSFIPVCPEVMSTFLEAPFPYIIGIHSSLSMKLLEGFNMVYCVFNVDAHYVANIGMEDFPPSVLNYIDIVAEKIKTLIHSYSPIFPFVHIQREIRNFIKGTLANSYGLDPDDFGYKELMADFIVWRDESSSEYAAYFSQSQTVDHFMHSLENSEYEKDDRVFKAFFPNETFMGTVHIPRQLVEESIEKEKEDGIEINIADLQLRSKSYPKTAVKVNNDRMVNFDSPKKAKDDSPKKIQVTTSNSSANASDSESSRKTKHKHKHKHNSAKELRSSVPISNNSDLKEELKVETISQYPIHKKLENDSSSTSDSDMSLDSNINVEKIISNDGKNSKQTKKKNRNTTHVKSPVSTFSADSASEADASSSVSDSEQSLKSLKSKRRVPPDLPAIPTKKLSNESQAVKQRDSNPKSPSKKKKSKEKKKESSKTTKTKTKSSSRSETDSENRSESESEKKNISQKTASVESESDTKSESDKKSTSQKAKNKTVVSVESESDTKSESDKKSTSQKAKNKTVVSVESESDTKSESDKKSTSQRADTKTVLIIESDSDVDVSPSNSDANSDNDSESWSSSSSEPSTPHKAQVQQKTKKDSKQIAKRISNEKDSDNSSSSPSNKATKNQKQTKKKFSNEEDLDNSSSSASNKADNNKKQTTKSKKSKSKKKKPYNFNSDSESNNSKNTSDYESDSNAIHEKENESVLKMVKKSEFKAEEKKKTYNSDSSNSDDDSKEENEPHSFIDSPIPKKKSKYVQENDLVSSSSKNKAKSRIKNKSSSRDEDDNSKDESEDSDDLNDPSLKKKYKKSTKKTIKKKNKYDSDSDHSFNSDNDSD